jgi:hypothetical protein
MLNVYCYAQKPRFKRLQLGLVGLYYDPWSPDVRIQEVRCGEARRTTATVQSGAYALRMLPVWRMWSEFTGRSVFRLVWLSSDCHQQHGADSCRSHHPTPQRR